MRAMTPHTITTADHHSRVRMDPFDRDILKDMLLWDPHGALHNEDLFPEFDMNIQQFRERFVHLVTSYDLRRLDHADLVLVEGARRYLSQDWVKGLRPHGNKQCSRPDADHDIRRPRGVSP